MRPEIWNFTISGLEVVKSWLAYRMKKRAGKSSSSLDAIRPAGWQFDEEVLDLLWVLEATLDLLPEVTDLLNQVLASDLFVAADFPRPKDTERRGPSVLGFSDLPLLVGIEAEDEVDGDEEELSDLE